MKNTIIISNPNISYSQHGFALIASLLFLVLMTLLALSMFNGLTLDEKMGGNLREKSRAIESAQAAIRAGEFALQQFAGKTLAKGINPTIATNVTSSGNIVTTCTSSTSFSASPITICLNSAESVSSAYDAGVSYQPSVMTKSASGGIGTYSAFPTYYIQYLGQDEVGTDFQRSGGLVPFYLITGRGTGGNGTAVAVIQSVYSLKPDVSDAAN